MKRTPPTIDALFDSIEDMFYEFNCKCDDSGAAAAELIKGVNEFLAEQAEQAEEESKMIPDEVMRYKRLEQRVRELQEELDTTRLALKRACGIIKAGREQARKKERLLREERKDD